MNGYTTTIEALNEAGRLLNPDGWIDVTELASPPTSPPPPPPPPPPPARTALSCCDRPAEDHPKGDPTMFGTCQVHDGAEVRLHWDSRRYLCGLCAIDAFHAARTGRA